LSSNAPLLFAAFAILTGSCSHSSQSEKTSDVAKVSDGTGDMKFDDTKFVEQDRGPVTVVETGGWDEEVARFPDGGVYSLPLYTPINIDSTPTWAPQKVTALEVVHHPWTKTITIAPVVTKLSDHEVAQAQVAQQSTVTDKVVDDKKSKSSVAGMTWVWIALAVGGGGFLLYKFRSFIPLLKLIP
jgi:hypothetical protein